MTNNGSSIPTLQGQDQTIKRLLSLLIASVILVISLSACSSAATSEVACSGDFEAAVHSGKNAGLSLAGKLSLHIQPSGNFIGTLATDDSASVQVTGYAVSQALNLVFDLGDGRYLFGVGSSQYDIGECKGVAGGPFTGPEPGDSGDWGYTIGGTG
ncbi:MAG: hypothetical protein HYR94_22280 [Chloroflexi bacterium]|nr:hypothetical protein [Chloroflexota bacterium]